VRTKSISSARIVNNLFLSLLEDYQYDVWESK